MNFKLKSFLLTLLVGTSVLNAQVTTNSGSGLAATYTSLASAITALNGATITSPVVITLTGNETAPTGTGYYITATGTAANTIIIEGSASTITAGINSAGGNLDAVFKIVGGDYITIQNFTIQENSSNTVTATGATNTMTEAGILLIHASATNGAKNNTIVNNTISLSSSYPNTVGIFSTSASTTSNASPGANTTTPSTNAAGTNSDNTISQVSFGIMFLATQFTSGNLAYESGNTIGASGAGNTITFGNNTTSTAPWSLSTAVNSGIYVRNNLSYTISYNTISNGSSMTSASIGVNNVITDGSNNGGAGNICNTLYNTITLTNIGTNALTGIFNGSSSQSTINVNNNVVVLNQNTSLANPNGAITGISFSTDFASVKNATANKVTINQNYSPSTNTTNSSNLTGILMNAGSNSALNCLKDTIYIHRNYTPSAGTATMGGNSKGIDLTSSNSNTVIGSTGNGNLITMTHTIGGAGSVSYTTLTNFMSIGGNQASLRVEYNTMNTAASQLRSGSTIIHVHSNSTTNVAHMSYNSCNVNTASGSLYFLSTGIYGTNLNANNNNIILQGTQTVEGINWTTISTYFYSCKNNTISILGNPTNSVGIRIIGTSGGTSEIANNKIDITSGSSSISDIYGVMCEGTSPVRYNVHHDTINITTTASGTMTRLTGIYVFKGSNDSVYSNIITGISSSATSNSRLIEGIKCTDNDGISVFRNKIYNLHLNQLSTVISGGINGISCDRNSPLSVKIYDNLIGSLTAATASGTASVQETPIQGIKVYAFSSGNAQVYNNTIYLSGTISSGVTFGATGINFYGNTAQLDLKNNLIINDCVPAGSVGIVSALILSGYNNRTTIYHNSFYASTGTICKVNSTSYNSLPSFQSGLSPYEMGSIYESTFSGGANLVSTTGSNANFLKPAAGTTTGSESGGLILGAPFDIDYDGTSRPTSVGYDIGAWEFAGTVPVDPSFSNLAASPALTMQCSASSRMITIDITPNTGSITSAKIHYSFNGILQTPITMTNTGGNTFTGTIPVASPANAAVSWYVNATNTPGNNATYVGTSYTDAPNTGITGTATASKLSACVGVSNSLTFTTTPSGQTITSHNWHNGTSTVSTSNPYNFSTATGSITYVDSVIMNGCLYVSNPVTISNPAAFSMTAINSSQGTTFCNNLTTTLTPNTTGGCVPYTYIWTGGSTNPTLSPTTSGTYHVTVTDNFGTSATASISLTINPAPTSISLSQTSGGTVCLGGIDHLTATGGVVSDTVILSENFNGSPSWTTVNNGTGGTPANADWTLQANGYTYSSKTFNSNDNTQFYLSNSEDQGSGGTTATELISPSFSTANIGTPLELKYYHSYEHNSGGTAAVEISTDGGTSWTNVSTHSSTVGSPGSFALETINLNSYLHYPDVKIKFKYDDAFGFQWAIDNVEVKGGKHKIVWSPSSTLYTDAAATVGYNGTSFYNSIYAKPNTATTYTATSTLGSCSVSATISVGNSVTITSVSQVATVTAGSTADFDVTGLPVSSNIDLEYNIAGGSTNTVSVTSDGSGNATFTSVTLSAGNNGQTLTITKVIDNSASCSNNVNVSCTLSVIVPPTITLGSYIDVCHNSTSFDLPYTSTTQSPDQYSVVVGTTNPMASFSAISNATLNANFMNIPLPSGTAAGTYDFDLTVTNSTTGLTSGAVTFNIVIHSSSAAVVLATASATAATAQCIDGDNWTYYATSGSPNDLIFAIKKGTSTLTGETVDIEYSASNFVSSRPATGLKHQSFIMGRGWNVNASSFTGSVNVRFLLDLATDTSSVVTERNDSFTASAAAASGAALIPFSWFKTVSTAYNSAWRSGIAGNAFPSHVKLTPIYGTFGGGIDYVQFNGLTSFSGGSGGAGFGAPGVGLPVTWAGFEVKTKESGNELIWQTASEQNTSHFEIEYSYDARNFIVIEKTIPAAGNSADLRTYQFSHLDFSSYVYYRIKQVDLDGNYSYSNIKIAKRSAGPSFSVHVYPVPLNEDNLIHVSVRSIDKSLVRIRLTDVTGKVIRSNSITPVSDAIQESYNLSPLTPGVYFIEVQNAQGREIIKIVK